MAQRPPFELLRFAAYLLGVVVLLQMLATLMALAGCTWVVAVQHAEPLGACANMATTIRDIFSETLTGILALLVAARPPTKPPDDPDRSL